jgi:hypothetical protein
MFTRPIVPRSGRWRPAGSRRWRQLRGVGRKVTTEGQMWGWALGHTGASGRMDQGSAKTILRDGLRYGVIHGPAATRGRRIARDGALAGTRARAPGNSPEGNTRGESNPARGERSAGPFPSGGLERHPGEGVRSKAMESPKGWPGSRNAVRDGHFGGRRHLAGPTVKGVVRCSSNRTVVRDPSGLRVAGSDRSLR